MKKLLNTLWLLAIATSIAVPVNAQEADTESEAPTTQVKASEDEDKSTEATAKVDADEEAPQIEVCFVLDTTGSMKNLIQGAKDKIWSIANELMNTDPKPNVRFALIGYRDRNDDYITRVTDLSDDIDAIHTALTEFQADGGGDAPESVNQALFEAVNQISWSEDREMLKVIFLVGDAPPHMDYDDDIRYPEICKQAIEKHLIINTVQCGNMASTKEIWAEISSKAEGSYVAIQQSGGTVPVATPFDKEIALFNVALNRTVCGYGDSAVQECVDQKIMTNEASKGEAISDRNGYFSNLRSKGGAWAFKAIGGDQDLIEKLATGKMKLEDVDIKKLPKEYQKLSKEEREAKLLKLVEERKGIAMKLDQLAKKRSRFLSENKAEAPADSFDTNVKAIIREQASEYGIR